MKFFKTCILCALLSLLAAFQASAQSIVGAWTAGSTTVEGASVVVFLANGYYFQIQNAQASEAPHGFDGFERGTYTWNSATGALTVTTVQDLNGDTGFSDLNGASGLTFTVSGDAATLTIPGEGTITGTRVTGTSPIVGAWSLGNPAVANSSGVVVFLPNGVYFEAEDGAAGDPTGHDGIEHGTYAWNPTTGLMTSSRAQAPYLDTNGEWGLSHTGTQLTFLVSADGLTLNGSTGPADSFSLARVGAAAATPAVANYQGMWAVPNLAESGWGINLTHQADILFASWFTYGANGKPLWMTITAYQQADGSFTGDIDLTGGPPFSAVPFNPALVTHTTQGAARFTFSDANNGSLSYTINGVTQVKALARFLYATPVPVCTFNSALAPTLAVNYQDMWAVPNLAEAGWGINFTHQGDLIFASWFTYDLNGVAYWVTGVLAKSATRTYAGPLDATTGPPFNAVPFNTALVTHSTVGTATVTFTDGANGSLAYTLNGVTQTKPLTRFVFRAPGTVCQ